MSDLLSLVELNARNCRARGADFNAERELELAARLGVRLLSQEDAEYPDLLKSIPDAPILLYVLGKISFGPADLGPLAFVGSRRPTPYGRRMAKALAGAAAASGAVIVSGMARGIDTEAHQAALQAGGTTWAVWGSGLNRPYPSENAGLAREIAARGGCCLSEFPLSTPPAPHHFPRRNRIVSGLSWATVVVEGEIFSGSLITARLAAEQGRAIFAVPGPADSRLSDAPHLLISEGAKMARTVKDIWEELPEGARPALAGPRDVKGLAQAHRKILELLGSDAVSLERLSRDAAMPLSSLTRVLVEMELEDLVIPVEGQRYAKK